MSKLKISTPVLQYNSKKEKDHEMDLSASAHEEDNAVLVLELGGKELFTMDTSNFKEWSEMVIKQFSEDKAK